MVSYGMVIDLKRCVGCGACILACRAENGTARGVLWARVLYGEVGRYPNVRRWFLPLLCMHCKEPLCEKVCPTGATSRRQDGIVVIDYDKCVGCRYCMTVCPYEARFVNKGALYFEDYGPTPYEKLQSSKHQLNVVEKCNFCIERVTQGIEPACVSTCMTRARIFGDLDDPNSEISKILNSRSSFRLLPELGTEPSVYYLPP
jgi:Fe-S-cluster-containing dehydrogenase component